MKPMKPKKQKAGSLQDQVLEHIHSRLTSSFGAAGTDRIMSKLSTRLREMTASPDATVENVTADSVENVTAVVGRTVDSVETRMTVGVKTGTGAAREPAEDMVFLTQLNSIVYPFIALMQVLEELPTDSAMETLRIWNTLPWTVVDKARRL